MQVRTITSMTVACALSLPGLAAGAADVTSTFDSGLEGWTAVGFLIDDSIGALLGGTILSQTDNSLDMVHDAGTTPPFVGNGGGFARFTDMITDPGSFASAPSAFLGDLSAYLDGTFSFDHRLFNEGAGATQVNPYAIAFISGDPNDFNAYGAVFPSPGLGAADTGWVTLSTALNAASLQKLTDLDLGVFDPARAGQTINGLSGGLIQTTATLDAVLANVTQILVSFELVDNNSTQVSEAGGIDNPTLRAVPEPASLALFGLGVAALIRRPALSSRAE